MGFNSGFKGLTRKLRYLRKRLHWKCLVLQLLLHLIIDSVYFLTPLISIDVDFLHFTETLNFRLRKKIKKI